MSSSPVVSVIIPTYNWSSALRLALESVRDQTLGDFEVLIVGDGCSDDSEATVRSFNDGRFHWTNLAENHGSQWAANNCALEQARGRYVAYLGHDDLWWPTHLQVAVDTLERTGADMSVAIALFYGPQGSGLRGVTGCFPHDNYHPRLFVPPSSFAHRLDLVRRIGPWLPMEEARFSIDNDFVIRASESGAQIVPTGEMTTFKFSAGWRRDSYLRRDATEQRVHLEHMRRDGEAFRLRELTAGLHAAALDRFSKMEVPLDEDPDAVNSAARRWAFKGSRRPKAASRRILEPVRSTPNNDWAPFEWHHWESGPLGAYRWSGPATASTLVLPLKIDCPLDITFLIVDEIAQGTLQAARLDANGSEIAMRILPGEEGARLWTGRLEPSQLDPDRHDDLRLTVRVERTHRPFDLGKNEQRRWVGLAVGWVEIKPLRGQG